MEARTPPALGAREVQSRASTGAALLGTRGLLVYGLGVAANLALASLLAPRDFGLVALGTVVLVLGTYLAEGGLGATLIRRDRPPEHAELQAVTGLQLAFTAALAALAAACAVPLGRDALVVALMATSLPIAILRAPSVIVLERELRYRVIATADILEALAYYGLAVAAVALGAGVWGVAAAVVVRSLVGTTVVLTRGPTGFVRPRWSWAHVRPLIGFGLRFQASGVVLNVREQGINVLVAAVAGLPTLGVWNLAWRVLQVPALLFQTAGRVAFPAASRLLGAGRDARTFIERGLGTMSVLTAVAIVGLVGVAEAIPPVAGDDWADVPAVILWAGIALIVAAPVTVSAMSYLYAAGDASTVVTAALVSTIVWAVAAVVLLPPYGAPGVGLGWIAAGIANAGILWRRAAAHTGARLGRRHALPALMSLSAVAAAWLASHWPDDPALAAVVGFLGGELLLIVGLALVARPALRDAAVLVGRGMRTLRA